MKRLSFEKVIIGLSKLRNSISSKYNLKILIHPGFNVQVYNH